MQAFDASWQQSPSRHHFQEHGWTNSHPVDLHIDLGNFCNLACKMCNPQASSRIAAQHVKWGITSSERYLGTDWTQDAEVWTSFKAQLLDIPKLNNIHFMGGETLLTSRFEDLVDHFLANGRTDVCFSFVTNGTVFRPELMTKLSQFRRVGIEVSIESTDATNAYQRQGTDTNLVLDNIQRYHDLANSTNITVTLRPAPSALTIGSYHTLLRYALDHGFNIKSNLVYDPRFLAPEILPLYIRQSYWPRYQDLVDRVQHIELDRDYNASDPHNAQANVAFELRMTESILHKQTPQDSQSAMAKLVAHCDRWDREYALDARELYPEWHSILDQYGYTG
jgi:organic radical activating enzyme